MNVVWLVLALMGVVSSLTFVVGYHVKTEGSWARHPMGRHLVEFVGALAFLFGVIVVSRVWGPLGPGPWIVALVLVNVVMLQRNWLLFTSKWRRRGRSVRPPEPEDRYSDFTVRN